MRMLNCISNFLPSFSDEESPTDSILNYPEAESPTTLATAEANSPCYPEVETPLIASTGGGLPCHPEEEPPTKKMTDPLASRVAGITNTVEG